MSYITPLTINGMLSSRYKLIKGGYKKNSKQVNIFNNIELINEYIKDYNVSLSYLTEEQKNKILIEFPQQNFSKSNEIISIINENFLNRTGKKFKEFREAYNHWNSKIIIKNKLNDFDEIQNLIDNWKKESGEKYGWIEHSGYDLNFFKNIYPIEKEKYYCLFFYLGVELVGYSIVEKSQTNIFNYVIRKTRKYIDLCLYIDYITIKNLNINKEYFINWGCSSGNLKKYKSKFPIASQEKRFSCKLKKLL